MAEKKPLFLCSPYIDPETMEEAKRLLQECIDCTDVKIQKCLPGMQGRDVLPLNMESERLADVLEKLIGFVTYKIATEADPDKKNIFGSTLENLNKVKAAIDG